MATEYISDSEEAVKELKMLIRTIPDFPKPGIMFRDVMPLFKNPKAVNTMTDLMVAYIDVHYSEVDVIVGLEARGFLIGPLIACQLEKPFVPIRKEGKLPGETISVKSVKEYGEDILEMQVDAIQPDQKVVVVDDLLATGGTMAASCELVKKAKGTVLGCICLIGLSKLELDGLANFDYPCHCFITYEEDL